MIDGKLEGPFAAEFLSTCLAYFMALSVRTPRWTKARVADYISSEEEIPGRVSDTTIGRLLDPGYPQEPSEETLQAVAAFLLKMRAITPDQIRLAIQSPSLLDASSFPTIFPRPETQAYQLFLSTLVGRFGAVDARDDRFFTSELVLRRLPKTGVLIVKEVAWLFHVSNMDMIKRSTRNLAPDMILTVHQKLPAAGGKVVTSSASAGFVVATSEIMALLLRADTAGFQSVINVKHISFAENGSILGLDTWRNDGWTDAKSARSYQKHSEKPRDIARLMLREIDYHKFKLDNTVAKLLNKRSIKNRTDGQVHDFFQLEEIGRLDRGGVIEKQTDIDSQLVEALDWGDIEEFRRLLAEGANPNVYYRGSHERLIFILSNNGRLEFVKAVLATGRCDLTVRDEFGLPPSHSPGETARMFAEQSLGPDDLIVNTFSEVRNLLLEEEIKQLRAKRPAPRSPAP
ncbi:hypothetical protein [Bosea sp. (in: a-proteobacteria)]|uniref:hypothetical protein n=1 Tax=Bosea sp. (in: a-proteobacteria) TaxID=1871050 RepID=UPI0040349CB6